MDVVARQAARQLAAPAARRRGAAAAARRRPPPPRAAAAPPPPPPPPPPADGDWVAANADALRALPLAAGAAGIALVLANRLLSGIAPVAAAGSAQSRADVVVIAVAAVLVLTGVQWASLRPAEAEAVALDGDEVAYTDPGLPPAARAELLWAWEALRGATRARTLVAFWRGRCVLHAGLAARGHDPAAARPGPLCAAAAASGAGNYLPKLALFPGRAELTGGPLPGNAQAAIVHPLGAEGALVLGADAPRAFTRLDQAWVAALAEKLEVSLEAHGRGAGFAAKAAAAKGGQ
jgi:hypothetical protein